MLAGTRLGPYQIIDALGHGGMGDVYRARDTRLHRLVAIKTVAVRGLGDPEFLARFDREARAVAALSHPNVLAIHDVGNHEGIPYVAVELLEGETLKSRIGPPPLPVPTVLDYASQVGSGLAAAHERGIVHRDLKPDNIFVTRDGRVKLIDFGLATEPDAVSGSDITRLEQTERGTMLGTAGYMSPEQARGERMDTRSDIFSFGCVLYEMLTGRRAFSGNSRIETLHAVLNQDPPDLAGLRTDLPPTLERVVRRCLEKLPERRFQNARDLVFALETLSQDSEARPSSQSSRAAPAQSKRALVAGAIGVVLLSVTAGLWWMTSNRSQGDEPGKNAAGDDRRRVLAVLPFENVSNNPDGYLAAGMTREITNRLSQLSALRVVGSAAVAQFKEPRTNLAGMANDLGIGAVVAGTVREDAGRVRVNVELLDARSGQVLWSEQYDREGVDVFDTQSDIALRVSEALKASVTLEEQARIGKRPTSSVAAYELFVRASKAPGKTAEERLTAAIGLLRQAVALDPRFAEAYSDIANRYYFLAAYGDLSAFAPGLDAAHKALDIDPQLASAHHALAMTLQQFGRLQDALPAHRRAIELDPNYTDGLSDISFGLVTAGLCDEALKNSKRALELTRNRPAAYYHVGVALSCLDDDARVEQFLTEAAVRYPSQHRLKVLLAFLDLRRGEPAAAVERMREAAKKSPNNIEVLIVLAEIATFAGAPDAPQIVRGLMDRAADAQFHNAPYTIKLAHAYHLGRSGSRVEADKLFDEMLAANAKSIKGGADWPMVFMQNAAIHALRGDSKTALDELERAYTAGWRDGRMTAIDPMLASLRSEPRFTQLLSRIATDVTAMRERADFSGLSTTQQQREEAK